MPGRQIGRAMKSPSNDNKGQQPKLPSDLRGSIDNSIARIAKKQSSYDIASAIIAESPVDSWSVAHSAGKPLATREIKIPTANFYNSFNKA